MFMKDVLNADLQNFLKSLLPERDLLLTEMEKYAQENHVSIVEPEVGQLLSLLIKITRPKNVLEIGTAIGYSTIWMARALEIGSQITTIELLPGRYKQALKNFQKAGLHDKIKSINGDAREILPNLQENYDFIFLDAAKGQYPEFFKLTPQILKPGGLLVFDNVLINGWVIDLKFPERRKKTMVYRMRNFLEELKNNKDYLTSIIPLGDGVLLCWKKGEENE
ncbi:MAG: O-methyltransferase [Clostridia bacterium]|nr:O-methyltransferase [Clostridia bacterium]